MLLWVLFATLAYPAHDKINATPLSIVDTRFSLNPFPAGANGELSIEVELPPGFFAYENKFKLEVLNPKLTKTTKSRLKQTVNFTDPNSGKVSRGAKGRSTLTATIEIPEQTPPGFIDFEYTISYQACTEKYCLFPTRIQGTKKLEISSSAGPLIVDHRPASRKINAEEPEKPKSELESWFEKGLVFAFLFAFIGGILTSFTPCIFPMIPVTLAVLGASGRNKSRLARFGLSLSYVLGIALMYSIMGVIAASTGALFGSTMQNPFVVGTIALVFVALALAMYGVWELQVPAVLRSRLANQKSGTGWVGAFFTGAIAGIVASPCVGPVLISILTYVAQTQDLVLGFALLFTFAMGLGQIFIVIGLFSEAIEKLPRAGNWMNLVNFVFGASMLGAAGYFLQFVIPAGANWIFAGFAFALTGLVYQRFQSRIIKALSVTALTLGLAGMAYGANLVFINPPQTEAALPKNLDWIPFSPAALEKAIADQTPVMIDFYADWCLACKEFEKITFIDPTIEPLMKQMTLVKVDATEMTEDIEAVLERYGVLGLPTLIFIDRAGRVVTDLTVTGFEDAEVFRPRLETILKR